MISARTKEALTYWGSCFVLGLFIIGCAVALVYQGWNFMQRIVEP